MVGTLRCMNECNVPTSLFGLSAAARAVPCSESSLRNYERRGIVHPIRDSANRRLFSANDIDRARVYRAQTRCYVDK